MDNVMVEGKTSSYSQYAVIGVILALSFATVVVAFGMDTIIMGAHDVFHDFRHVMGMPCH